MPHLDSKAHEDAAPRGWVPRMVGGGERHEAPVAILLSVYNGEAFLNQQLDSFVAQTHRNWTLYWRDDGSDDASRAIMLSFQAHRGLGRCIESSQCEERLGVAQSFAHLLTFVPSGTMVAYADQDDVWLPEKLGWAVAALADYQDVPVLYCARQYLTDASLTVKGESPPFLRPPGFEAALTQNIATGHTIMLSPAACALLTDFAPPDEVLHDWWAYLVVTVTGGVVIADGRCVSYYRQHGRNVVGANRSRLHRALAALSRGPHLFMATLSANVAQLMSRPDIATPKARALLVDLTQTLPRGRWARARLLRRYPGLVRQTPSETWLFRIWFVLPGGR